MENIGHLKFEPTAPTRCLKFELQAQKGIYTYVHTEQPEQNRTN